MEFGQKSIHYKCPFTYVSRTLREKFKRLYYLTWVSQPKKKMIYASIELDGGNKCFT